MIGTKGVITAYNEDGEVIGNYTNDTLIGGRLHNNDMILRASLESDDDASENSGMPSEERMFRKYITLFNTIKRSLERLSVVDSGSVKYHVKNAADVYPTDVDMAYIRKRRESCIKRSVNWFAIGNNISMNPNTASITAKNYQSQLSKIIPFCTFEASDPMIESIINQDDPTYAYPVEFKINGVAYVGFFLKKLTYGSNLEANIKIYGNSTVESKNYFNQYNVDIHGSEPSDNNTYYAEQNETGYLYGNLKEIDKAVTISNSVFVEISNSNFDTTGETLDFKYAEGSEVILDGNYRITEIGLALTYEIELVQSTGETVGYYTKPWSEEKFMNTTLYSKFNFNPVFFKVEDKQQVTKQISFEYSIFS